MERDRGGIRRETSLETRLPRKKQEARTVKLASERKKKKPRESLGRSSERAFREQEHTPI